MRTRIVKGAALKRLGITPGNTELEIVNENLYKLRLHGHEICTFDDDADFLVLNPCGWYTATTKKRMNQFLYVMGLGAGVYQRDYKWYFSYYSFEHHTRVEHAMSMESATMIDLKNERITRG